MANIVTNIERGEEVEHQGENQSMSLSNEQYGQIVSLLQHFHMGNNENTVSANLSSGASMNFAVKLKTKEGAPLSDPTFYRKLVEKLNFLTNTRLDIAYGVQHLSQFMQDSREPHLQAAYHMLRYLKKDPTLGLYFSNEDNLLLVAYCDSDWAACPYSRRSVSGYVVFLGGSPISWKPYPSPQQKQNTKPLEKLLHIGIGQQLVDVLSKALTGIKHCSVLGKLGVISSHPT
uniref:Uncharacterized mitochondrial protein AtMg00810-like n=1 Tax=Nicotiana tabacum TaxID=4097 RepID=A0A1S4DMZ9_TOBAC|nr:PREDICTED: uncharacterized mitochondrial protein AtMg00810-like [Nicotiana tabacum]